MLSFKSPSFVNQPASQDSVEIIPKLTLFGHNARIWDCYVSDSVSCHTLFPLHHLAVLSFFFLSACISSTEKVSINLFLVIS